MKGRGELEAHRYDTHGGDSPCTRAPSSSFGFFDSCELGLACLAFRLLEFAKAVSQVLGMAIGEF
jgi:hypothetical protein